MPLQIASNIVLCGHQRYVAGKPVDVGVFIFIPTENDIGNIAYYQDSTYARQYIFSRAKVQFHDQHKYRKELRSSSQGTSFLEADWRQAYEMHMPKRVLWYEEKMERVAQKIAFMQAMTNHVKAADRPNMLSRIRGLQDQHSRFLQAHDKAMKKVYAVLGG